MVNAFILVKDLCIFTFMLGQPQPRLILIRKLVLLLSHSPGPHIFLWRRQGTYLFSIIFLQTHVFCHKLVFFSVFIFNIVRLTTKNTILDIWWSVNTKRSLPFTKSTAKLSNSQQFNNQPVI